MRLIYTSAWANSNITAVSGLPAYTAPIIREIYPELYFIGVSGGGTHSAWGVITPSGQTTACTGQFVSIAASSVQSAVWFAGLPGLGMISGEVLQFGIKGGGVQDTAVTVVLNLFDKGVANDPTGYVILQSGTHTGATVPVVTNITNGVTATAVNDKNGYTAVSVTDKNGYYLAPGTQTGVTIPTVSTVTNGVTLASSQLLIKKNVALNNFEFLMVLSTDHVTPGTGLTVTATRSIDGGVFGACTNSPTEISNGMYVINLSAADLNGTVITLKFAAATADTRYITIITQA